MGNCVARDIPDPQTGLTPNHINAVRQNWKLIEKRLPEYGLELFVAFITKHPEWLPLFPFLKPSDMARLSQTPRLKAFGTIVLRKLGELLSMLDSPPKLIGELLRQGANHRSRGLAPENFQALQHDLNELFVKVCGPEFDIEAWDAVLTLIMTGIEEGLRQAKDKDAKYM
ncbi:extracellular globin-1-like [Paramacrobiotus metropolitanus]|nr:extracellular globin-1-like [Paramacrobiotus metropolitanus]